MSPNAKKGLIEPATASTVVLLAAGITRAEFPRLLRVAYERLVSRITPPFPSFIIIAASFIESFVQRAICFARTAPVQSNRRTQMCFHQRYLCAARPPFVLGNVREKQQRITTELGCSLDHPACENGGLFSEISAPSRVPPPWTARPPQSAQSKKERNVFSLAQYRKTQHKPVTSARSLVNERRYTERSIRIDRRRPHAPRKTPSRRTDDSRLHVKNGEDLQQVDGVPEMMFNHSPRRVL